MRYGMSVCFLVVFSHLNCRYCIEVPTENGALFEMGDQRFLELCLGKSECNLFTFTSRGARVIQPSTAAPIIVIFTKYDLLISKFERELYTEENQDMPENEFEELVAEKASEFFEEVCVKPLKKATDIKKEDGTIPPIPYAFISSKLLVYQPSFSLNFGFSKV
jgi:hypothetical protein